METALSVHVRPPWPDELWRLRHFLPGAFYQDANPRLHVAVAGRAERLIGAVALSMKPLRHLETGWLGIRLENHPERLGVLAALLPPVLDAAWEAGARAVALGRPVATDAPEADALRQAGFEAHETLEVYEAAVESFWPRLQRIHERMQARGIFPAGAELTPLLPDVIVQARRFLREHLPQSVSALALESSGYSPEHSLALWLDGKIKGVWLCRRVGSVARVSLRLIAPELRGGLAWANFLLLHASMDEAVRNGMERGQFELNPALHEDTRQLADTLDARLVDRLAFYRLKNPALQAEKEG